MNLQKLGNTIVNFDMICTIKERKDPHCGAPYDEANGEEFRAKKGTDSANEIESLLS
ncbi:hypothetical protein [Brasilonema sp. UFV-L1]|uniref:hypothetical protein n=1 Tax=Brasilonema sp. UFV-L1 TaxID=2234130 RepID=UPI00145D0E23|nr:hypothetical protein [Brasilonema sp. UFV-L1]